MFLTSWAAAASNGIRPYTTTLSARTMFSRSTQTIPILPGSGAAIVLLRTRGMRRTPTTNGIFYFCALPSRRVAHAARKHGGFAWLLYGCGVLVGFLAFCAVLRWQPYGARLLVPLFAVIPAAPGRPCACASQATNPCARSLCFSAGQRSSPIVRELDTTSQGSAVLSFSLPVNPGILQISSQWTMKLRTYGAADLVARSGCRDVGTDISRNQLEYPFQALVLQRNPNIRFQHVGVENASNRYRKGDTANLRRVVSGLSRE